MIITKEWLNKHKTANGAWTKRQIEALGLKWPVRKGWQKLVIGREIGFCQIAFESGATSKGSKDKTKELQQQIIGLNKKIVELQAIIEARDVFIFALSKDLGLHP